MLSNYTTHCSIITVVIHNALQQDYSKIYYGCNNNTCTLCTGGSIRISRYLNSTLSILLLLYISKPHLVQAGLSMRLANYTSAQTQTCKNGGYHYFTHLYLVVISNSIPFSEYCTSIRIKAILNFTQQCFIISAHNLE